MHRIFAALFAAVAFLVVVGCSGTEQPKRVNAKGKLMEGSNPFIVDVTKLKLPAGASLPPGTRPLTVSFIPVDKGETAPANVDAATGLFTVALVPGKYKIAVSASAGPGSPDLFNGKFSAEKTQIVRDVKENDEIVIDLSKPQGQ
jgi:hypothetical protein